MSKHAVFALTWFLLVLQRTAFGHVSPTIREGESGSTFATEFRVSHGCDGATTYKMEFHLPEGTLNVKPNQLADYTISSTIREVDPPGFVRGNPVNETVDTLSWTGLLPDGIVQYFGMRLQLPEVDYDTQLCFPIYQKCVDGYSNDWVGKPGSARPAPCITVNAPPTKPPTPSPSTTKSSESSSYDDW